MVAFAKEKGIDFAVVAPDDPLVLGMVDALNAIGIPCFGPDKKAAILEGSKVFSKNLMKKYGIPTAAYEVFDDMEKALAYLETAPLPTVVKADGLALGKGVIIAETKEQAQDAVRSMMADKVFGRKRRPCRYRGIYDRTGGFRSGIHRRENHGSYGFRNGSQESIGW